MGAFKINPDRFAPQLMGGTMEEQQKTMALKDRLIEKKENGLSFFLFSPLIITYTDFIYCDTSTGKNIYI